MNGSDCETSRSDPFIRVIRVAFSLPPNT
jgi:hypothetical protein